MIYDDKNRQRLTAEIQNMKDKDSLSVMFKFPKFFFLSRGDVRQSKIENLKVQKRRNSQPNLLSSHCV